MFVVSAASGSGKSTIVDVVLTRLDNVGRVITCTTRAPRGSEQEGRDYYFLSTEAFENRIAAGDFLEYAHVHGRLYGTSRSAVEPALDAGTDLFLVIDVQGAESVRRNMPDAVTVFILPPSYELLKQRLRRRCEEENHTDEQDLAVRLATARDEVRRYSEFQYVIVNDELERAVGMLEGIVRAERCRTAAQRDSVETILKSFGVESLHA